MKKGYTRVIADVLHPEDNGKIRKVRCGCTENGLTRVDQEIKGINVAYFNKGELDQECPVCNAYYYYFI
jgi:hypothetical protein